MAESEKYTKILGQMSFSYIITGLQILLAPVSVIILTRALGTQDYGAYNLFTAFIAFAMLILQPGLQQYVITKLHTREKEEWPNMFLSVMYFEVIFLAIVLTILMIKPVSGYFLGVNKLNGYELEFKLVLGVILFSTVGRLVDYYYRAKHAINLSMLMEFLRRSAWVLLLIPVLLFYKKITLNIIFAILGGVAVLNLLAYLWIMKEDLTTFFRNKVQKRTYVKEALKFGLPLLPVSFISWLITASDRYMLNYFKTTSDVGIYSLGYSLLGLVVTFGYTIFYVLQPYLTSAWNRGEDAQKILSAILKYGLMLIVPAMAGLFALREEIVTLIAGREFAGASVVIVPLLFFPLFSFMQEAMSQVIILKDKTKFVGATYFLGGAANIALNYVLIPPYGMVGAAIATTASYGLMMIINVACALKFTKLDLKYIKAGRILLASAVMGVALHFMNPHTIFTKIAVIGLGAVIYCVMILLTKAIDKEELGVGWSFVKSSLGKFLRRKPPEAPMPVPELV